MKHWLLVISTFLVAQTVSAQKISGVSTTVSQQWAALPSKNFGTTDKSATETIEVYPEQKEQEIEGFGGCFNEIGWEALNVLGEAERTKVMNDLFSAKGANFSICRMPIGASDYALSWYSLNDVPDDFTMRNFNIDRDRYILIPYIKAAQKVKPDLKIWASPWSPPTWMKINNHYTIRAGKVKDTTSNNEMDSRKNILNNATAFRMEDGYLEAYALYFSKFIQAYRNEGINIWNVQIQNEIAYAPQWPACTWRPEDMSYFIKKFLGPRFKTDNIATEIWLGTINYGNPAYVRTVLNDTAAAKYISGVGFQWGGKNAIGTIKKEYPQFNLMQTESECGEGENNWKSLEYTWNLIQHYLSNGARSYIYWNMVLDNSGQSSWGWSQNMLVSINKKTGTVKYNPEYFLFKHISHFVLPGAHKLKTSGGKNHLAFMNPDGTVSLIYVNQAEKEQTVNIAFNGKMATFSVKPKAVYTLNWE